MPARDLALLTEAAREAMHAHLAQVMDYLCQPMAEQQHLVKAMQVHREIVLLVFSIAQVVVVEQEPQEKLYHQHLVVVETAE